MSSIKTNTLQMLNIPSWYKEKEGELLDIYCSFQKIGSCSITLVENQKSPRKSEQIFPDSWFLNRMTKDNLPILEIIGLETIQSKNVGNGRSCLQAIYQLSRKKGCAGRMQVISKFGAGSFYEHCGFKGPEPGVDGIKYFDPIPENLKILFNGSDVLENYLYIPVSTPKSEQIKKAHFDEELFQAMLKGKSHQKV